MNANEVELQANSLDVIHYKVMELIHGFPPGKVLDFPAGFGRLSYWLKEKGHDVTSCDIAVEEYTKSPIQHIRANLNGTFPFADDMFDYAFCIDGPEHAENLYHTFREFYRVIKPNGMLIVSMPNFSNLESRLKQLWYGVLEPVATRDDFANSKYGTGFFHINRPPYAMLRMAIEAAQWTIAETTYDKKKKAQAYLYPLYVIIKLITWFKGVKGDKKYWLKSSNQKNVLMGGNTLILICQKEGEPSSARQ